MMFEKSSGLNKTSSAPFVLPKKAVSATFPWMKIDTLPLVAIVGRPNVGKSTLFNAMVGERKSIVSDISGTTRDTLMDKIYGATADYWLLDTAGLTNAKGEALEEEIQKQVKISCEQADLILFLLDGTQELTSDDRAVADRLRKSKTPFLFVANKVDDGDETRAMDLAELGLGMPLVISAKNYTNMWDLQEAIEGSLTKAGFEKGEEVPSDDIFRLAIVGRPNVGKSSLINQLTGSERVVVSNVAGTTRDSIDVAYTDEAGQDYLLIDTAGLRRPGKVGRDLEFWSSVRTRRSMERADVCVILIDALDGVTRQDMSIIGEVIEAGKGVLICVNKLDLLQEKSRAEEETDEREIPGVTDWGEDLDKMRHKYEDYMIKKLPFCPWAKFLFFSAKTGRAVNDIFPAVGVIGVERKKRIATAELNRSLPDLTSGHVDPSIGTKRGKIKYVSQVDSAPPKFLFFVNNIEAFHFSYQRYLENKLREKFGFEGTPITVEMRDARENMKKKY